MTASQQMMQLIVRSWAARAAYSAVELGLPELLADGVGQPAELAERTGTDEQFLGRFLDYLVSLDICAGGGIDGYRLGPLGQALLPDAVGSVRDYALLAGTEFYPVWSELSWTLRHGEPAFARVHGEPLYDYLAHRPEASLRFDAAMNAGRILFEAIPATGAFDRVRSVVDIAGGNGELLAAVLQAHPDLTGTLFEDAAVLAEAEEFLTAAGVGDRARLAAGDMFAEVPPGADGYLLSRVLVNWDDDRAATLLANCAAAMGPTSRLLIVERPQHDGVPNPTAAAIDVLMMLLTSGGQSRTVEHLGDLLGVAGLEVEETIELPRGFVLLSCRAVPAG